MQNRKVTLNTGKKAGGMRILPERWKEFWAYAGPVATLVGLWTYWCPSVYISAGVNINPAEQLQTQFIITNNGHVPVYDVKFTCSILPSGLGLYVNLKTSGDNSLQAIKTLEEGQAASRGCFAKSLVAGGPWLKVVANYKWPLIGKPASKTVYFSVRTGPVGSFLVPEAAPSPEPPTFIQVSSDSLSH